MTPLAIVIPLLVAFVVSFLATPAKFLGSLVGALGGEQVELELAGRSLVVHSGAHRSKNVSPT